MTFYVEIDDGVDNPFEFSLEEIGKKVATKVLSDEKCPYEAQINLLLTDDDNIREMNREFREIDKPTDVLSFPNVSFDSPSDFDNSCNNISDCFDPDTDELVLGDIVINKNRVISQAEEYGHSFLREFAFLVTHSMLHLLGYDHMEDDERIVMERKQEEILDSLGITRDL